MMDIWAWLASTAADRKLDSCTEIDTARQGTPHVCLPHTSQFTLYHIICRELLSPNAVYSLLMDGWPIAVGFWRGVWKIHTADLLIAAHIISAAIQANWLPCHARAVVTRQPCMNEQYWPRFYGCTRTITCTYIYVYIYIYPMHACLACYIHLAITRQSHKIFWPNNAPSAWGHTLIEDFDECHARNVTNVAFRILYYMSKCYRKVHEE